MALYPEVQKKAQAEIDAVVGPNRFPDFHDRPSLPYINAVVKESSRWNLVLPFGKSFFLLSYQLLRVPHPDEVPKVFPTCLLSTMNIMATISRKGQS